MMHPIGSSVSMARGGSLNVPVAAGMGRSPSMIGMPTATHAYPVPTATHAYPVFASPPPTIAVPTIEQPRMTAPQKFTEGIPDEVAIMRQKQEYGRNLDDQLHEGTRVLHEQNKKRKDYLNQVASQQKAQFNLQVDQQLKAQEMALDQQYSHQLMTLQQAAHEQQSALEAQANGLALDYQQKKAHEDFAFQQYEIQRSHYEAQSKFSMELKRLEQQERETVIPQSFLNPPQRVVTGSYVPPPTVAGGLTVASYSPPPTVMANRPSLSFTGTRSALSFSALPTATVLPSYSAPPTSYSALPTTYASYAR